MPSLKHNLSPANQPWSRFRTQAVRDLVWSCSSPALMVSGLQGFRRLDNLLTPGADNWFAHLDREPHDLLDHLASAKSRRLGIYFEQLLAYLFSAGYEANASNYRMISRNLPIRSHDRTLGELDFLMEDRGRQLWHLEVAVKFYLGSIIGKMASKQSLGDWHQWLGPNARDRLGIKLEHMLGHQLSMGQTAEAEALIRVPGGPAQSIVPAYCLRGILFFPGQSVAAMPAPDAANPEHLAGYWVTPKTVTAVLPTLRAEQWLPLERHEWLAGPHASACAGRLLDTAGLLELVAQRFKQTRSRPLMCQGLDSAGQETVRIMTVADYWPLTDSPSRIM